jgi:hypothetical protein
MNMITYAYSALALLAVCHALAGEPTTNFWGPVTNNVQMAINVVPPGSHFVRNFAVDGGTNAYKVPPVVEGEKSEVKVGQPFSLLVRIRNLSTNETFTFLYGAMFPDAEWGLVCIVVSPSGKDVSPSANSPREPWSGRTAIARPGQTTEFEFPLSELCKLEEIGTYKITVRKSTFAIRKGEKGIVLTSNTLSVSVVPDK